MVRHYKDTVEDKSITLREEIMLDELTKDRLIPLLDLKELSKEYGLELVDDKPNSDITLAAFYYLSAICQLVPNETDKEVIALFPSPNEKNKATIQSKFIDLFFTGKHKVILKSIKRGIEQLILYPTDKDLEPNINPKD